MKHNLIKLALISSGMLLGANAAAQSSPPSRAVSPAALDAKTKEAPVTVAANVKPGVPLSVTRVNAAGSVIVLADGIVANASMASFQPPARGFVYER